MVYVTLGNPLRKDRKDRQIAKSGEDSAISQHSAVNRSAKDSRIPSLLTSEEMNPPGRQEDCDISPTSLPKPDGEPLNLAFGSNTSADEVPETRSTSSEPGTSVPCALPTNDDCASNATAPTEPAHDCNSTEHTIPAGTNLMSAHNPSVTKVNPKARPDDDSANDQNDISDNVSNDRLDQNDGGSHDSDQDDDNDRPSDTSHSDSELSDQRNNNDRRHARDGRADDRSSASDNDSCNQLDRNDQDRRDDRNSSDGEHNDNASSTIDDVQDASQFPRRHRSITPTLSSAPTSPGSLSRCEPTEPNAFEHKQDLML